jgi:hypothetical protein
MIDDMQGLYSHASDAYRAGKRAGRDDFFRAVIARLGFISVEHEGANNVPAFHAAEECCKAVVEEKTAADAPKKIV